MVRTKRKIRVPVTASLDVSVLDSPRLYEEKDPSNFLGRLRYLPRQCQEAWKAASAFELPHEYGHVDKVMVVGMGGSAIGGELLRGLAAWEGRVPVLVHRDYDLPRYVNSRTLVIASSYSGATEETLSAFQQAQDSGAKLVVITTGGPLGDLARERGVPWFPINYVAEPRSALGYSFFPLLSILQRLGFIQEKDDDVVETTQVLDELLAHIDITVPAAANPAKALAGKLQGRLAVIYGAGVLSAVAHRWKTQINENSKAWACYEVFPELNHNAIVGYRFPAALKDYLFVVLLRSAALHPRTLRRYDLTQDILTQVGVAHQVVEAKGASLLSQMLSIIFFGDFVSYYLALLYDIDPAPVEVIDYLKEHLSRFDA